MARAKRSSTSVGSARRRWCRERAFGLVAGFAALDGFAALGRFAALDGVERFAGFDGFDASGAPAAFDVLDLCTAVDCFAGASAFTTFAAITRRVPCRFPTRFTRWTLAFFKCALSSPA